MPSSSTRSSGSTRAAGATTSPAGPAVLVVDPDALVEHSLLRLAGRHRHVQQHRTAEDAGLDPARPALMAHDLYQLEAKGLGARGHRATFFFARRTSPARRLVGRFACSGFRSLAAAVSSRSMAATFTPYTFAARNKGSRSDRAVE